MIYAINFATDEAQGFEHDDPVAAVVTAHCGEVGLMSWLTNLCMEPPEKNPRHNPEAFPEINQAFDRAKTFVSCGNWAVSLRKLNTVAG